MQYAQYNDQSRLSMARFYNSLRAQSWLIVLGVPGLLFFLFFAYLPMAGLIIAFQDFNHARHVFDGPFVGLANFRFLHSPDFSQAVFNTIFLNTCFIVTGLVCQVGLALLLNEIRLRWFRRVTQSTTLLPYFISWVVVAMMARGLFASAPTPGLLVQFQKLLGQVPISWYTRGSLWVSILIFANIWKWIGYGSVIYLAAIVGIDPELYEAARVDGASRWQRIRYITIPMLKPTISILTLLAVGRIFYGDFLMIYGMVGDNGLLLPRTDVIDTYVYRALRIYGDIGMASAAGLLQAVMGFGTIICANLFIRRIHPDGALF